MGIVLDSVINMFGLSMCETPSKAQQPSLPRETSANFPTMVLGDKWVFKGHSYRYGSDAYHQKVINVEDDGSFVIETVGEKEGTYHRYYDNKYQLTKMIKIPEGTQVKTPVPPREAP